MEWVKIDFGIYINKERISSIENCDGNKICITMSNGNLFIADKLLLEYLVEDYDGPDFEMEV